MLVLRAYKTRLDINRRQASQLWQCCGAARWCFNWGLAAMLKAHDEGRKTSAYAEKKRLNAIKDDIAPWLRDVPYTVLQGAFDNLGTAYQNFFRRCKNGDAKKGFPKFKSRKNPVQSFNLRGVKATDTEIRAPRLGWLRLKEHGYLPRSDQQDTRILSATLSRRAGEWYVSLQVKQDVPDPESPSGPPLGIDLGIKTMAYCSDGRAFGNPKATYEAKRKMARLSRELSRRKRGGENWKATKVKIAKQHARIADIRRHHQHEVSAYATKKSGARTVVVEDLNVSGMLKNHHLARAVSDVGMYELRRQITYKAEWNGVEVVKASTWYPSSKTCSNCGVVRDDLTLADRLYVCPECGATMDRDLNAAMNLAALAH